MPAGKLYKVTPPSKRTKVRSVRRPKKRTTYASAKSMKSVRGQGSGLLTSPSPFPLVWKGCKQRFGDSYKLYTGAGGTYGSAVAYSINDMYDPRQSVGGEQPYARDTMVTLYDRYKVTGVTVQVEFTTPNINGIICGVMFNNPTNTSVLTGNVPAYIRELPNAASHIVADTGKQKWVFRKHFPMWKVLGVTKLQFEADIGIYDALSTGSPSLTAGLATMRLAIANIDTAGAASAGDITANTVITMHTDWYQRKSLARS